MQKVSLLGFLIIALVSARNIPLQLEIGIIQIDNLLPGKMQQQNVQFEQPFPQVPQVALSVQQLLIKEEYTFFSKITNITNQGILIKIYIGFTIDILSASEQSLSYRYMAMIDDRVQINCLNFKVKERVFVQFKRPYQKQPKVASYITGLRGSDSSLQLLQEITREGIHFTFQNANKTQIIGLCTVAGTQDSLSYTDIDIPQFSGLLGINKNSQIGIEAQASVICDNVEECDIYFQRKFENIDNIQKKNNTIFNLEIQTPINEYTQFPKVIRNWNESEILPQLQTNSTSQGLSNIKQIIAHEIQSSKNNSNTEQLSPQLNNTKTIPPKLEQKKKYKNKQKISPNKQQMNKSPIVPKMINLQNEFSQLKQISNDQTKQANIPFDQQNRLSNDYVVVNKFDSEPETTAEKLIELKQLERAPKLQPKYQQLIDEAKLSYYSTIQHEDQIKQQSKQESVDQVSKPLENISQIQKNDNQANQNLQKTQQMLEKQFKLLEEQIPSFEKSENHENHENTKILLEMTHNTNLRSPLNSVTPNPTKIQQSSMELLESFNHIDNNRVEETKQQNDMKPSEERFSRLHNYVEKAENTEINFLQTSIVEETKAEEIMTEEVNHIQVNEIPYSERLKQRKNEIMLELKQKYNIKTETNVQENVQLQMSQDLYPQILYEKELEEIRKTTQLPKRKEKLDDTSYQLEAAYYEWTLHKE